MVEVYKMKHLKDNTFHVLKVLQEEYRAVPEIHRAFFGEYRLRSSIEHPNLAYIENVWKEEGAIVLEWQEGENLDEHLRKHRKVDTMTALRWAAQVLTALHVLHQHKTMHLEINLSNVFLIPGPDGTQQAILMDHGIGHRVQGGSQKPSFSPGSTRFLSPELISNPRKTGFRSDIYSLGVVLFEILSGENMVSGDTEYALQNAIVKGQRKALKEAAPQVPTSIALVIEQALQIDPVSRYPTAKAFMDALSRAVGGPLLEDNQGEVEGSEIDALLLEMEEERQEELPPEEPDVSQTRDREEATEKKGRRRTRNQAAQSNSDKGDGGLGEEPGDAVSERGGFQQEETEGHSAEGGFSTASNREHTYDERVIVIEGVEVHSTNIASEDDTPSPIPVKKPAKKKKGGMGVLILLMLLGILAVGLYKAQKRNVDINLIGKPDWGQTKLKWNDERRRNLSFEELPTGEYKLHVDGGVFEGKECTRCCWERDFTVSIPMGLRVETIELSLEGDTGYPTCPTLQANYLFSPIPVGAFDMGSEPDEPDRKEDELLHRVVLTQPFTIGQTEVTQMLYQLVMNENPSRYKKPLNPVENVSWYDAVLFCNKLSEAEGLEPCYQIDGRYTWWKAGITCKGYRLPTEAEWEYAARGGIDSFYAGGDDPDRLMWHADNSSGKTHEVATLPSNKYRLFDMSGNVQEWVWDYYAGYSVENFRDPKGPISGEYRVLRGGDWYHRLRLARVSARDDSAPIRSTPYIGFRITQSLEELVE
ncbi:MAG: bifunctional serine/threonine-protein kinase/formylglycine-generating enzyme family protein [Myxococcota bacterium]|nr:bifunctional serine/threonine-protein kinase/formylglycine-generating enzyme family protein [Myxococcota bacterium]